MLRFLKEDYNIRRFPFSDLTKLMKQNHFLRYLKK